MERLRRLEAVRIKKTAGGLTRALREMTLSMSFVDDLHTFYRDLLELSVGTARYRHALGKVGNAAMAVRSISREALMGLRTAYSKE